MDRTDSKRDAKLTQPGSRPVLAELLEDQVRVLNYVSAHLGGPESIRKDLRCAYQEMIDQGLVQQITIYRLTEAGEAVVAEQVRPAD